MTVGGIGLKNILFWSPKLDRQKVSHSEEIQFLNISTLISSKSAVTNKNDRKPNVPYLKINLCLTYFLETTNCKNLIIQSVMHQGKNVELQKLFVTLVTKWLACWSKCLGRDDQKQALLVSCGCQGCGTCNRSLNSSGAQSASFWNRVVNYTCGIKQAPYGPSPLHQVLMVHALWLKIYTDMALCAFQLDTQHFSWFPHCAICTSNFCICNKPQQLA